MPQLHPKHIPQFIVLSFDDNGLVDSENNGGLHWLRNYLKDKHNPASTKIPNIFNNKPVRASFFMTARYGLRQGFESKENVLDAWKSLYRDGHEIGNHSTEHLMTVEKVDSKWHDVYFDGKKYSKEDWLEKEFNGCHNLLTGKDLNFSQDSIKGWRTPRISEWNNEIFSILEEKNYLYDSSLEYYSKSGTDFTWPHALDCGSPFYPKLKSFANLWELPVYNLILPEELSSKVENNTSVKLDIDFFLGKDKGGLALKAQQYAETLINTLNKRLAGNRCPFVIVMHSDIYSTRRDKDCPSSTARERQQALENFIEYSLAIEGVCFVTAQQLISYLKENPFHDKAT